MGSSCLVVVKTDLLPASCDRSQTSCTRVTFPVSSFLGFQFTLIIFSKNLVSTRVPLVPIPSLVVEEPMCDRFPIMLRVGHRVDKNLSL